MGGSSRSSVTGGEQKHGRYHLNRAQWFSGAFGFGGFPLERFVLVGSLRTDGETEMALGLSAHFSAFCGAGCRAGERPEGGMLDSFGESIPKKHRTSSLTLRVTSMVH